MGYVKLSEIPKQLNIMKGDRVFISSAVRQLIRICRENGDDEDLNVLIDAFINAVGEEGTVIFPTYNWDWCKGCDFDYIHTPSQVGALSSTALGRSDFKRTRHPIYFFAVWGRDQEYLCNLENKSAFGADSPFAYFVEKNVKNVIINVEFKHSFTFVHFVEEQLWESVSYRYMKNFRANYIDEFGEVSKRVYSMMVRSYWWEVVEEVDNFEDDFISNGAQVNHNINGLKFAVIDLAKTYPIIKNDILYNGSKKLCSIKAGGEGMPVGQLMHGIVEELFPICRSITGEGLRNSLQIIKSYIPLLRICEITTGTKVYDWEIPKEWNVDEAYIEDESGSRIVDFKQNNLHLLGYSAPMDKWMELEELKQYIYTAENQPDVIPYVTSYYKTRSGFCMSRNQLDSLPEGRYHAVIKSELKDGALTYGELYLPGETEKEILFSTYLCHPSMANNELSGPAVATYIARYVSQMEKRKYSYRFLFIPETIGSIAWLSRNYDKLQMKEKVIAGFVLTCVGDERTYSFVSSRYGNTLTDKLLRNVMRYHYPNYKEYSFLERGSDERQYNSPGIDLPVCSVCRSKFGEYPEYHTSADDLTLVTEKGLTGSYELLLKCIQTLEYNDYYKTSILCEPQLGKRGLYPTISRKGQYDEVKVVTNLIAYCDGKNDLIDISEMIHVDTMKLIPIVKQLLEFNILTISPPVISK